jgi:hypothetical protein
MPKTYTRLTEDERYQIYEGVTEKRSHREMATSINKYRKSEMQLYLLRIGAYLLINGMTILKQGSDEAKGFMPTST